MTNVLFVSLAYKAVALQFMVAEANFYAERLNLSEAHPILAAHVIGAHIDPPRERFGLGSFSTVNYFYSFPGSQGGLAQGINANGTVFPVPERGKLAYISKKEPFKAFGGSLFNSKLANAPSLIDTNGAYQLATQWLTAISVDVAALEKKHKPIVVQQSFYDPPIPIEKYDHIPKDAPKKKRPVFDVMWGGEEADTPPISVKILGATKELIQIRMENTTFSKRPPIVITNALQLNGRDDPPFKKLQMPTSRIVTSNSTVSSNILSPTPKIFEKKVAP